ncbi:CD15/CS22/SEF14 family fimbrial major subunit [Salmonella enterica subsp. enterica serovar Enteritidis]|nr:CD15/CS22/SEF14 family fimbrial major subunit [Salmonella enterica subsp. enterica serovar Enteritidis]
MDGLAGWRVASSQETLNVPVTTLVNRPCQQVLSLRPSTFSSIKTNLI